MLITFVGVAGRLEAFDQRVSSETMEQIFADFAAVCSSGILGWLTYGAINGVN